jgi:myosin heavy subunit
MPKKKSRRKEAGAVLAISATNGSYSNGSYSNGSYTNGSYSNGYNHNNSTLVDAEGASERGDTNGCDYTSSQNGDARSHQGKAGNELQPTHKAGNALQPNHKAALEPWIQAVGETVQNLGETQRIITNLQKIFMLHSNDLGRMDETSMRLYRLGEECREKDEELERREKTILTLTSLQTKARDENEREAAQIKKDKLELEQEREKQEKRAAVELAEEKLKLNNEFEERTKKQEEIYEERTRKQEESYKDRMDQQEASYEKRMKELEDEFTQKRNENDKATIVFEAEKERLSTAVKERDEKIEAQANELAEIKERHDVLQRAMKSIRQEMQEREAELELVKKEFALYPKPMTYFVDSFAEIESQIERISRKYFHSIEGKDLEQVHEELVVADPIFRSVPIEDSEDSFDLCTAHAQRIISKAICEDIWKPFCSEFTALQPELSSLLSKISDELEQSDHGGRKANVWTALTARALESLQANSGTSRISESTECPHLTGSARTDSVISKVSVLSPLVSSSQAESLRMDLIALVNSAVDVWNNGQAGGSKITVNLLLDRAHHKEWRSQQFDPAGDDDETNSDPTSETHPLIFPLFPRVMARGVGDLANHDSGPLGSRPADSDPTIVHPGQGLPEWSSLVVRGQADQEEKKDFFKAALEIAKRQLQSSKRASGHGRRDSKTSVMSGSPGESWKRGSAIEFLEI